jgi:H+/Cl- antiporter ClcA
MSDRALNKFGSRYILMMMLATRVVGLIGGFLTIYYMNLTLRMTPSMRHHWDVSAAISILAAGVVTVLLALWETRALRSVLSKVESRRSDRD